MTLFCMITVLYWFHVWCFLDRCWLGVNKFLTILFQLYNICNVAASHSPAAAIAELDQMVASCMRDDGDSEDDGEVDLDDADLLVSSSFSLYT